MLFGTGKWMDLSSLSMVANSYVTFVMNSAWVVTSGGEVFNNFDAGGADNAAQNGAGTIFYSGGVSTFINGSFNDSWTAANITGSDLPAVRLATTPAAIQGFRLLADENDVNTIPVDIARIDIYSSDNTTLLHSFDLDNATSATVADDVGSGVLTLTGFAFGATVTINEAAVAFGGTITFSHTGFGNAINEWTLTDSQGNVFDLLNGDEDSADVPGLGDDVLRGLTGTCTLTIGDGVDTATDTITLNAPSGYTVQPVLAGFSTTFPSVYQDFTGTVQEGEQSLYVTADWNSFDGLGLGEVPGPGTYTLYHISLDGTMQSYDVIFGEDGSYRIVRTGPRDTTRGLTRPTYRSV